jgi:hypothetical protein
MSSFGQAARHIVRFVSILFVALLFTGCGGGGKSTNTNTTTVVSPVGITSVFPEEARAGDMITIHGSGFGATQGTGALTINGTAVTQIWGWDDALITAVVPGGAGTGNVTVTVGGVAGAPGFLVVPWAATNPENVAVTTAANDQGGSQIIPDGSGGAIIAWYDNRNGGLNYDIYVQRVNNAGEVLWTTNGVGVCTVAGIKFNPQLIPDGSGGAIIVWDDRRSGTDYDIYAQRVSSAGVPQWTANGVTVVALAGTDQKNVRLVPDGNGGAIVTWEDYRSGSLIYAQRLNSAGVAQWTVNGVAVASAGSGQTFPQIVSDSSGGAIIAWEDYRNGADQDIYAQRLNSAGAVQWTTAGVAVVALVGSYQNNPHLIADGNGGAIVAWEDNRSGSLIYAQRMSNSGVAQWTANGVAVAPAGSGQGQPQLAPDGSGGAIIAWKDYRSTTDFDIYAQRLNSAGALQWTTSGMAVIAAAGDQDSLQLIPDGSGGAIIAWMDDNGSGDRNVYAQRLNSAATKQWASAGVPISTGPQLQQIPQLTADGNGGAIITWMDDRNDVGISNDIYVQGITASGNQ